MTLRRLLLSGGGSSSAKGENFQLTYSPMSYQSEFSNLSTKIVFSTDLEANSICYRHANGTMEYSPLNILLDAYNMSMHISFPAQDVVNAYVALGYSINTPTPTNNIFVLKGHTSAGMKYLPIYPQPRTEGFLFEIPIDWFLNSNTLLMLEWRTYP